MPGAIRRERLMTGVVHRPMSPLWRGLCKGWAMLDDHSTWLWWSALNKAQWSVARTFREQMRQCDGRDGPLTVETVDAFIVQYAQPGDLMVLLEQLNQEGHLSRRDASAIESALLKRVNADGAWKPYERRRDG